MNDEQKNTIGFWERLATRHQQYLSASTAWQAAIREFKSDGTDRVALMRYGLKRGSKATAFQLAEFLSTEERKVLLSEWILFATGAHSELESARSVIKSLPRDWLIENIEDAVEPLLQEADADDYYGVLDLYVDLDFPDHFARLANHAAQNSDPSIQQVGEDAIQELNHDLIQPTQLNTESQSRREV